VLGEPGEKEVAAISLRDIPMYGVALSLGSGEAMEINDDIRRFFPGGVCPDDTRLIVRLEVVLGLAVTDIAFQRSRIGGDDRHDLRIDRARRPGAGNIEQDEKNRDEEPPDTPSFAHRIIFFEIYSFLAWFLRYFYLTRANELGYPGEFVYFCAPKRTRVTWARQGKKPEGARNDSEPYLTGQRPQARIRICKSGT
jgi:hypothetical protein